MAAPHPGVRRSFFPVFRIAARVVTVSEFTKLPRSPRYANFPILINARRGERERERAREGDGERGRNRKRAPGDGALISYVISRGKRRKFRRECYATGYHYP